MGQGIGQAGAALALGLGITLGAVHLLAVEQRAHAAL